MKAKIALILCSLFVLFVPSMTKALELKLNSRTYLNTREDADNNKIVPLHEYVDLRITKIANTDVSFELGGWLRKDLTGTDSFDNKSFNSDLQYAYFEIPTETIKGIVKAGRIPVVEGVALVELVDGVYIHTAPFDGLGLSLYGGVPVETDKDDRGGDYIYGSRISYSLSSLYTIGLSYLKERNDSDDFREEAGLDLSIRPMKNLDIYGRSFYNVDTSGWMEHSYYIKYTYSSFNLAAEISWYDYENQFSATTNEAFKFDEELINPDEELLVLGGKIGYSILDGLNLVVDYKKYSYDIQGNADYYGAKVRYENTENWGLGISIHRMDGDEEELKYLETRAYLYANIWNTDFSLDMINHHYDEERNDVNNAYEIAFAATKDLTDNLRLGADLSYAHNSEFDSDFRTFLKLLYSFSASYKGGGL
jgi:hypothetical protein